MPRKYQIIRWNGRDIKRRVITKAEDKERVRKMLATRAAKRAAALTGTAAVRSETPGRKPKANAIGDGPAAPGELEELRARVHQSLVYLGNVRKFLKDKYGPDAIDAADHAHKAAMFAEDILRKR